MAERLAKEERQERIKEQYKEKIENANKEWNAAKEQKPGFFTKMRNLFSGKKSEPVGQVISGPFNVKHEGGVDISKEDIAAHAARDNIDLQGKTPQKGTGELIQGEINQNAKNAKADVKDLKKEHKKEWDGVNNRTKEGRALRKEVDSGRKTPEEASSVFKALRGIMGHHSKRGLPTIEEVGKKETPHAANTPAKNGQQKGHSAEI